MHCAYNIILYYCLAAGCIACARLPLYNIVSARTRDRPLPARSPRTRVTTHTATTLRVLNPLLLNCLWRSRCYMQYTLYYIRVTSHYDIIIFHKGARTITFYNNYISNECIISGTYIITTKMCTIMICYNNWLYYIILNRFVGNSGRSWFLS